MDESDDIANLFKQFGGRPDNYQELGRASEAKLSRERWPLLASVEATRAANYPPVNPGPDEKSADPLPAPAAVGAALAPAPATSETPATLRAGLDALKAQQSELAPAATQRAEPHLPPEPAIPEQAAAVAPAGPAAEFIAPRAKGPMHFGTRMPPVDTPSPFSRPERTEPSMLPAPEAPPPEPAPTPVAAGAPPATPPAASSDLQRIFARLAQPAPPPDETASINKNATLLQRLSRL